MLLNEVYDDDDEDDTRSKDGKEDREKGTGEEAGGLLDIPRSKKLQKCFTYRPPDLEQTLLQGDKP